MRDNKSISCTVSSCKYNNVKTNYCVRSSIKICNCNDEDGFKESTMCDSYKER